MSLHETQTELERDMVDLGERRYERNLENRGQASTAPGMALILKSTGAIAERLTADLARLQEGKAGRYGKTVLTLLVGADPRAVAYIAIRRAVQSDGDPLTNLAISIGGLIEEHLALETFRGQERKLANWWMERAKQTQNEKHARKVMAAGARASGIEKQWSRDDHIKVGLWLIESLEDHGLVTRREKATGGGKSRYMVDLAPALAEYLAKAHGASALAAPFNLPMVVPPLPWTTPFDGGYLTRRNRLVTGRVPRAYVDDLASADLRNVYASLNAVQETAWRINPTVMDVVVALQGAPAGAPGIPPQADPELPARPADVPSNVPVSELTESQRESLGVFRRAAKLVHDERASLRSNRVRFAQQLWVAGRFAGFDAIYFPHRIDSRGRIYPISTGISPQGNDLSKGLLQFASRQPLGEDGAFWLAVHTANTYGEDKVTFDERVQWVADNEEMILEIGMNPADTVGLWSAADGPWQFLAACLEWTGYVLSGRSEDYESALAIGLDGSCSGLQHFSAALRDEVGGRAVNLLNTGKVEDIYTEVANRVNGYLDSPTCEDDLVPWRGKVDRKIVKQPCMTFAYSSTLLGMRDMIVEVLKKRSDEPDLLPEGEAFVMAAKLAPVVRTAIEATVIAAAEGMAWLQQAAVVMTDAGIPLEWVAASGLPVRQIRTKPVFRQAAAWYGGQRLRLRVADDGDVLNKQKQKEAIAPNWVHSQDAAHLVAVVNMGSANGIEDFAMVHDSFGTHAGNASVLAAVIRKTFVEQYTPDRFAELRDQLASQLDDPSLLPDLPTKGSLRLESVLDSDYFFA